MILLTRVSTELEDSDSYPSSITPRNPQAASAPARRCAAPPSSMPGATRRYPRGYPHSRRLPRFKGFDASCMACIRCPAATTDVGQVGSPPDLELRFGALCGKAQRAGQRVATWHFTGCNVAARARSLASGSAMRAVVARWGVRRPRLTEWDSGHPSSCVLDGPYIFVAH